MQPEVNSFETMEEELPLDQEEINEIIPEVLVIEEPTVEEPKPAEPVQPAEVRTPFPLPIPPKRHPRNIPKFSKPRNGN